MKKWDRWYIFLTMFWIVCVLMWQFDWSNRDAPAWVQAIGSMIAIFTAIGIAMWQRREESRQKTLEQDQARGKAERVARLAITLLRDGVNDLVDTIPHVPPDIYRAGVLDRTKDQRMFLSALSLDLLDAHQATAMVKARDACSLVISLLLRPDPKDQHVQKINFLKVAKMLQYDIANILIEFDGVKPQ